MTLNAKKKLYVKARDTYYNTGSSIMTDAEFDALEDEIREADPKWPELKKAGSKIKNKKTKIRLPVPMFSLDKLKANTVEDWLAKQRKGNVILSDKLDGASLELVYEKGVPVQAITRGDGKIGGNVSYLIPHMRIPQKVGTQSFIIRCEALFSGAAFSKYKKEFTHPRNAASGLLNNQEVHKATKDLSIVVLQVLKPVTDFARGLAWAKAKGFTVVAHKTVPIAKLNAAKLTKLVEQRKAKSKYALDGVVITLDGTHAAPTNGNPDWAKAFKINVTGENAPVTTVKEVVWEVSHTGRIVPTIKFDPIDWEGASLQYASAFNAKYIIDNKIGKGSRVAIIRSGEIIPYIAKVIKQTKPQLPDPNVVGAYTLKGVHYVLTNPKQNDQYRIKKILKFFQTMEVDFIKIGTVTKLYEEGVDNISKWVRITPKRLVGFGLTQATAEKLYGAVQKVVETPVPLTKLMDASSTFPAGMGERRFQSIGEAFNIEDLTDWTFEEIVAKVSTLNGFQDTTARMFAIGLPKFFKWQQLVGVPYVNDTGVKKKAKQKQGPLTGVAVSWTGYRSKDEEATVTKQGGDVVPFGGKTTVLIYSPEGKASSKVTKASEKGIPTMTWQTFCKKYKVIA